MEFIAQYNTIKLMKQKARIEKKKGDKMSDADENKRTEKCISYWKAFLKLTAVKIPDIRNETRV